MKTCSRCQRETLFLEKGICSPCAYPAPPPTHPRRKRARALSERLLFQRAAERMVDYRQERARERAAADEYGIIRIKPPQGVRR